METKKVSLVNSVGCKFEGELTEAEIKQFESMGWKHSDKVDPKLVVANLVTFGV